MIDWRFPIGVLAAGAREPGERPGAALPRGGSPAVSAWPAGGHGGTHPRAAHRAVHAAAPSPVKPLAGNAPYPYGMMREMRPGWPRGPKARPSHWQEQGPNLG